MDVDLSTDLGGLPPMIEAIADDGYDVATGSRLLPESRVVGRTLKREITSRGYSLLFRTMFFTTFRDAQCGFKAASRRAADDLAPLVEDNGVVLRLGVADPGAEVRLSHQRAAGALGGRSGHAGAHPADGVGGCEGAAAAEVRRGGPGAASVTDCRQVVDS